MSDTIKTAEENYHALLMEYASGCLDEAHALVIATHMALSPNARKLVSQYEAIGGGILHGCCKPVAMKKDALQSVMDRLEQAENTPPAPCGKKDKTRLADYLSIPGCLDQYLQTTIWEKAPDGCETIHVKTTCSGSKAELKKVCAGGAVRPQAFRTTEITLVLQGGFRGDAQTYQRGDLLIFDRDTGYTLTADDANGCICFVVRPSSSPLMRLLKRFLKGNC